MSAQPDNAPMVDGAAIAMATAKRSSVVGRLLRNPAVLFGGIVLLIMATIGLLAPLLDTIDPTQINPAARNRKPDTVITMRLDDGTTVRRVARMGTDSLGRDIYSRTVYGARVSLVVGLSVAVIAVAFGVVVGLISGYFRRADAVIMRFMDGLMAIPPILLALTLVALWGAGVVTVIFAIVVPQIAPVVRLVRSVVLTVREEPYVEAAISVGTPTHLLLYRHVLPNTIAPLIVQGTFIAALAISVEAILSFLGVGIPPETPSWGNIMAEGRGVFRILPYGILYPGIFLALTVLAINILGDGLRDTLDPKMSKRV